MYKTQKLHRKGQKHPLTVYVKPMEKNLDEKAKQILMHKYTFMRRIQSCSASKKEVNT